MILFQLCSYFKKYLCDLSLYVGPKNASKKCTEIQQQCEIIVRRSRHKPFLQIALVAVRVVSGFPGSARGKELACQCRRHKRLGSDTWVGKIPWRRAWQPNPVFLPMESHGQRSLAGYSPWGCKDFDTSDAT